MMGLSVSSSEAGIEKPCYPYTVFFSCIKEAFTNQNSVVPWILKAFPLAHYNSSLR